MADFKTAPDVLAQSREQRCCLGVGVNHALEQKRGQCGYSRFEVSSCLLARGIGCRREINDVVGQLERDTDFLTEDSGGFLELGRCTGVADARPRGGRNKRAGLIGQHAEVVINGINTLARPGGLV